MAETGNFIWYELLTSDPAAAERFYGDVVGWTFTSFGNDGGGGYRIANAGGEGVGGVMPIPPAAVGMRPAWLGYVCVPDVDAAIEAALDAGATLRMPATDIGEVGRIALLADPGGASFYVMTPAMEGESRAFSPQQVGHFAWNELTTAADVDEGLGFYLHQFGWTRGEAMPMGPMGDYVIFHHGGAQIGGAMRRAEGGPLPMWLFYAHVADIEAAPARITAGGGKVLHGPAPVPGGSKIVVALDPQGAGFGLVGPAA